MKHSELSIHGIHPYAAKFNFRVPCSLLSTYSAKGQIILDPFSGSGTTLVEAMAHGCSCVGVDIHPLASLISEVKTQRLSKKEISEISEVAHWAESVSEQILGQSTLFRRMADTKKLARDIPNFDNRDHWFTKESQDDLGILRAKILKINSTKIRNFLWVALSCVILRASRQDSETRYKAINRPYIRGSAIKAFSLKTRSMILAMNEFSKLLLPCVTACVFNEDIRDSKSSLKPNSIDLVITSPPYANTYDYYLYHKHRMNWIGLDFRIAKNREIGSRLEFSSQKAPVEKFFFDMESAFSNIAKSIKRGGKCIVVQGDSRIAGIYYSGVDTIRHVTKNVGLVFEKSYSEDLAQISKTFNPAFAAKGKKEHVVILTKM